MATASPVRRQILGTLLRRYREQVGLEPIDAARILNCDRSKVSRIETGNRGIRDIELRALLTEYGVPAREHAFLLDLASPGADGGWWDNYADVLSGEDRDFLAVEALAGRICCFEPLRVPVLLQSEAFLRAVVSASTSQGGSDPDRAEEAMLCRQRYVLDELETDLEVVIGEAALTQLVGAANVMHDQFRHLINLAAKCPNLTIQVLPFMSLAPPSAAAGPMTLLQLPAAAMTLAWLTTPAGLICRDDETAVTQCKSSFASIQAAALSPSMSLQMLRMNAE